ncbi:MAG: flagellar basal-body MS-ring/collar protein FliF, partial [Nitrospinota bacterium]
SGFLALIMWSRRPDFQPLYTNLSPEDASAVATKLKERRIAYRLEAGGGTILVPAEKVHAARLELAGEGLPQQGGVGFEIFDRTNLGMTDFVQRMNYLRALQGELARTIRTLSEVDQARVHLVIPERTLFLEEERKPSASVVLKLRPGARLRKGQVRGIAHLVARSVEGLQPERVTIVDTLGNMLAGVESGEEDELTHSQREFQANLERSLERRVESMLDKAVGTGKSIVRVSAQLNFRRIERTEESFDPESQVVRSEQRTSERSQGGASIAGGVPGVAAAQGGSSRGKGAVRSHQKQSETINYEISKVVRRVVEPAGEVRKLSVAVMVDGTYERGADGRLTYKPRTSEELKKFEAMVKGAVGFDPERGDRVVVESVPFQTVALASEEEAFQAQAQRAFFMRAARWGVTGIVVILLFLFVLRPLLRLLASTPSSVPALPQGALPRPVGELVAQFEGQEALPGETPLIERAPSPESRLRAQVIEMVRGDPERAAQLLRSWIRSKGRS